MYTSPKPCVRIAAATVFSSVLAWFEEMRASALEVNYGVYGCFSLVYGFLTIRCTDVVFGVWVFEGM